MKILQLTGMRFGRLTALRPGEKSGRHRTWYCICDCGAETMPNANSLRQGNTRSCGCLKAELSQRSRPKKVRTALTAERLREVLYYEPLTGVFRWKVDKARLAQCGMIAGSVNENGYRHISVDGREYKAHRLAWLHVHGAWPTRRIDHHNGQTDDNAIKNLRTATHSQNLANSRRRRDNTSGYKGVSFFGGKWMANVCKDGINHYLGLFLTPDAAHRAYLQAAQDLHGEFARAG